MVLSHLFSLFRRALSLDDVELNSPIWCALAATDFRFLDRYYRRYFDKSLNGQEAANATVVALTSPPAGVTRRLLQTCAQVPEVPGCIDYTSCSLLQTPKCLCKSSCDLVPPAELDFDGYSGIRGTGPKKLDHAQHDYRNLSTNGRLTKVGWQGHATTRASVAGLYVGDTLAQISFHIPALFDVACACRRSCPEARLVWRLELTAMALFLSLKLERFD